MANSSRKVLIDDVDVGEHIQVGEIDLLSDIPTIELEFDEIGYLILTGGYNCITLIKDNSRFDYYIYGNNGYKVYGLRKSYFYIEKAVISVEFNKPEYYPL